MDTTPEKLIGHRLIADYVTRLDGSPGVYRMLDSESRVLYVGKAKNLKKRVTSYARETGHTTRILRMISQTHSMMFLTTKTETEALLLEQNLIKQLKPKFNILLRDDKSFPNILITDTHNFAQIRKHRGAKREKGSYYGPFANTGAVNRTLNQLQRVFLLRTCSDNEFENRTRPCLLYQIKRCCGPCVGHISKTAYADLVADAKRFLGGKSTQVQIQLAKDMQTASDAMEFERAAALRDRIKAMTQVQTSQGINPRAVDEADVIALHIEGGQVCIQVFFIRSHQNWGNRDYYPRIEPDMSAPEVMQAFIGQFYSDRQPPKIVLLSDGIEDTDLMQNALSEKRGKKVEILMPLRGEKLELVTGAKRNARESLARRVSEVASQLKLLKGLAETFDISEPPRRIEVYDNSHIQGTDAVGAMIVAGQEGFLKSQYRKFNIKSQDITPGDDFGMMKEVLGRRFSRLIKDDPDRSRGLWPDLLLIDGGAGQISAVHKIMADMGVNDMSMIGIAKGVERNAGKEEFYRIGKPVMTLAHNDPILYFVQRLRDEAHRFAISTHRAKRGKSRLKNPLDEIEGIGPKRKKALLVHFGSAKAIGRANVMDLKAVQGISGAMAQTIFDHFHDKGG